MLHNDVAYWRYLQSLKPGHPDLPSPRVCRLLLRTMEGWKTKPRWPEESDFGHLRDWLSPQGWAALEGQSVAIRKAHAIAKTLERITDPRVAGRAGSFEMHPDELIIGTLPPFSVGQGKEFVRYHTDAEALEGAINYQSEWGPMGHIVPDYEVFLSVGLSGLAQQCREGLTRQELTEESRGFFNAVLIALEGVAAYARAYAAEVARIGEALPTGDANRVTMQQVAQRLQRLASDPPETFHDALQAIHLMHCAFHWTQEIVPIGRLDQLLFRFFEADLRDGRLTREAAQELLDCFWIKLDATAILAWRHAEDRFGYADGPLTGQPPGPSNYDQGGLLNQWMQQITLAGVVANDAPDPTDATNDLTYLCLECARRLPLNSPTVDLRLHRRSPKELCRAAARTILSGGAHPVLLNDDRLVPALRDNVGGTVSLCSARNYACDGCYETLYAGETEFSFGFVPALDVLERTLNRGAALAAAGPLHLRGHKGSWRSKAAGDIADFEELWEILTRHILLACHRYFRGLLTHYGNKAPWSPSPLLSAFILGCLETGRDLTAGGARYHLFSPLMTGISTAVDSLYVIRELVFEQEVFSLDELVSCLRADWGRRPVVIGRHVDPERIAAIRAECLAVPKFGHGETGPDEVAYRLIETFARCVRDVQTSPVHAPALAALKARYDHPLRPFEILLAPGVGTFEQYNLGGFFAGASADGRTAGTSIASDLSPAPIPSDQPAVLDEGDNKRHARTFAMRDGLRTYAHPSMDLLPDGGPADYNIREDFPEAELTDIIYHFAQGQGGTVATFTVANAETFAAAVADPDGYNLVRVRMGGWSEFFIALFPDHQAQHRRRPLYLSETHRAS